MLVVLDKNYPSSKAGVIPNGVDSCFTHLCSWQLTKARNTNLGRFLSAFEWICFPDITAWRSSWQPVLPLPCEAFLEFGWLKIAAKGGNLNSLLQGQHCLAEVQHYGKFLWTLWDTGNSPGHRLTAEWSVIGLLLSNSDFVVSWLWS